MSYSSVLSSLPPGLPTIDDNEGGGGEGKREGEKDMDTSVASVATQNHAAVVEVSVHINVGKIGYNSCRPSVETA